MPALEEIKTKVIEVWENDHIVLPSVTAAQFILESASGNSSLAKASNNYFGIKASAPWSGDTHTITSNEEINGVMVPKKSVFRKYATWQDSVQDHSTFFISTETRKKVYAGIIGETDYKKACNAMTGSYATDSAYGKKLTAIIEANGLSAWDVIEEDKEVSYEIDYRIIDYSGRKTTANKYVIAHESGNPNNVGANSLEGEVKYMQGQAANGGAFTSHWVGSGGKIIQIAPVGKIQYGAGGVANPLSYAQVELARTNNAETFKKDYAAYVWLLRKLAAECGIPQTLDKTGNGIKTHLWVTNNLGNTDHTDPYAYLNSWGISNAQFVADIANGLDAPQVTHQVETVATVSPVRVPVSYNKVVAHGGYSIDSKPWGEDGRETWGKTDDIIGNTIIVYEENGSGEYVNGVQVGWIDKRALIDVPARISVSYNVTIKLGGYSIDSKPWGEPGLVNWGKTDAFIGQIVPVVEENASGEYINTSLGWIDKRSVEKEPVVVSSTLLLPAGQMWITYPENGPYKAGKVIAIEEACSFRVLGDKGQGLLVIDLDGNVGRVAIRYDESKGASITKQYA